MAAISQENLDRFSSDVTSSNDEVGSQITAGVTEFVNSMKEIWATQRAVTFAKALEDALTQIINAYRTNMENFVSAVNTNVQNYRDFSGNADIRTIGVSAVQCSVGALQETKDRFPDGFVGLRAGHSAAEVVEAFERMRKEIHSCLDMAATKMRSAEVFDEAEEKNAVANTFRVISERFDTDMDNLRSELVSALSEVDSSAEALKHTNVSNVSIN